MAGRCPKTARSLLATKVPKYAVPSIFIPLARMPLSMFHPGQCGVFNRRHYDVMVMWCGRIAYRIAELKALWS
jgi:hypothetical protein